MTFITLNGYHKLSVSKCCNVYRNIKKHKTFYSKDLRNPSFVDKQRPRRVSMVSLR